MRRFRVVRGGLDGSTPATPGHLDDEGDGLTRRLRGMYAPPSDGYWDGLEATIMAAVRAGRAAPAAAAEWWHTLARWARPGLAAAAVLMGVVGGVYVQTRGARTDAVYRAVLETPAVAIEPLSEEYARALDNGGPAARPVSADERTAAYLLTDGVKRRTHVPAELRELQDAADAATDQAAELVDGDSLLAGRRATSPRGSY